MQRIYQVFQETIRKKIQISGGQCLLYGAGNIGTEMLDILQKIHIRPVAFLDRKRTGDLKGYPIVSPENLSGELKNLPVILSVFSFPEGCGIKGITDFLNKFGIYDIISFESFYCEYSRFFEKSHYWLETPDILRNHVKELAAVYEMLSDSFSREMMLSQIQFRLTGDSEFLLNPYPVEKQYFDTSVYGKKCFQHFWDLGAFTGDTIENAIAAGIRFRRITAFEPDLENYVRCCQCVKQYSQYFEECTVLPLATGGKDESVSFTADASSGASVSEEGNSSVYSVMLDSIFTGVLPDFIKMDIEGCEYSTLQGMKNILAQARPLLAICIYHCSSDLYKIPIFLNKILKNYNYYIRCYGEHLFDTVLYCVPREMKTELL